MADIIIPPITIADWPPLAKAVLVVCSSAGGLALLGKLVDTLMPSAARRLDEERDRRAIDATTIVELRKELTEAQDKIEALTEKLFQVRQSGLETREQLMVRTTELEMLRTRIQHRSTSISPSDMADINARTAARLAEQIEARKANEQSTDTSGT